MSYLWLWFVAALKRFRDTKRRDGRQSSSCSSFRLVNTGATSRQSVRCKMPREVVKLHKKAVVVNGVSEHR